MATSTYSHQFSWTSPSADDSVYATGTFDDWKTTLKLVKGEDGNYSAQTEFKTGEKILYKYVVDGVWQHSPNEPTEADESGNLNNVFEAPTHGAVVAIDEAHSTKGSDVPSVDPHTAIAPVAIPTFTAVAAGVVAASGVLVSGVLGVNPLEGNPTPLPTEAVRTTSTLSANSTSFTPTSFTPPKSLIDEPIETTSTQVSEIPIVAAVIATTATAAGGVAVAAEAAKKALIQPKIEETVVPAATPVEVPVVEEVKPVEEKVIEPVEEKAIEPVEEVAEPVKEKIVEPVKEVEATKSVPVVEAVKEVEAIKEPTSVLPVELVNELPPPVAEVLPTQETTRKVEEEASQAETSFAASTSTAFGLDKTPVEVPATESAAIIPVQTLNDAAINNVTASEGVATTVEEKEEAADVVPPPTPSKIVKDEEPRARKSSFFKKVKNMFSSKDGKA